MRPETRRPTLYGVAAWPKLGAHVAMTPSNRALLCAPIACLDVVFQMYADCLHGRHRYACEGHVEQRKHTRCHVRHEKQPSDPVHHGHNSKYARTRRKQCDWSEIHQVRARSHQHEQAVAFMKEVGLPHQPRDLEIRKDDLRESLLALNDYVQGRSDLWYTVLNEQKITPAWVDEALQTLNF